MIAGDLLGERARLTPDAPALVCLASDPSDAPERLTYRQLDAATNRAAAALTGTLGLGFGDRYAVLSHNRREYVELFFAAGKTGRVLVTLSTRSTPRELAAIVRDSGARVLFYDGELAETAEALRAHLRETAHEASPEAAEVLFVALDELPKTGGRDGDPSYRELTAAAGSTTEPESFRAVPCGPEDLWCLLYTSGTTGAPKGVMIPHRQVIWNGYNTALAWRLRATDVSPVFTPMYHAGGLAAFLTPLFTIGGTIVLHRRFDAAEVWRVIEEEGVTVMLGVPTIYKILSEHPAFATADLSRVRWMISGGAPLPRYLIDAYQARGVTFKQGFGMTEVGVNCFTMTAEQSVEKAGSIGLPMPFTEVRLAGPDGEDVGAGEVGEMLFRGPHVCRGYWNRSEATAEALDAEGWFHSGDLARRDEEGFFYVAGRRKEMLISGGVNIYPAEIEAALLLAPGVEDAAVVGVPHERWGEAGVAFLTAREGSDLARFVQTGAAVHAVHQEAVANILHPHLQEHLARYKWPRDYVVLPELPRTPYGKVVKGDLRDAYLAERASEGGEG